MPYNSQRPPYNSQRPRKREYTSSQAKRTSDQMRSSMVGAHIPREGGRRGKHMNADAVGFSSQRRARRATRSQLDTFVPHTRTRESAQDYARRAGRREYAQNIQRKSRLRRIATIAISAAIAIVVAVAVGLAVFFGAVSGRMSLGDSNARDALVAAPSDSTSFYMLLTAELGAAQGTVNEDGPDAYVLARADSATGELALIWLPPNLMVSYGDGEYGRLRDAAAVDDATLVKAVSVFAGVDIAHFAETDIDGLCHLADTLGGITLTLDEEVDDPRAGDVHISSGQQTVGSAEIPTLLRAYNYSNGTTGQAQVQCAFIAAVLERLAGGESPLADATIVDSVSGDVRTDFDSQAVLDLASTFTGLSAANVDIEVVPGEESDRDGVTVFQAYSNSWTSLMEAIDAGSNPTQEQQQQTQITSSQVDPSSFTITVRNGAGITGAAAQMASQLTAGGFNVVETGNTDSPVYTETLIIWKDEAYENAANAVAAALTSGRVVNGGDYYSFDSDVLVVLGSDWQPLA